MQVLNFLFTRMPQRTDITYFLNAAYKSICIHFEGVKKRINQVTIFMKVCYKCTISALFGFSVPGSNRIYFH